MVTIVMYKVVHFRSSIYQSKAARSDIARFKMPATLKSPPGAKTRARRSSVYQKSGKSVLSPRNLPVSSRTRRSSIYIRGTNADNEFSKVFRTPIKPVEAVKSISEETEIVAKMNDERKTQTKSGLKQVAAKTPSPTKHSKNKSMKEKAKSPVVKHSPVVKTVSKKKLKTPEKILPEDATTIVNTTRSAKKTPATKLKSPKSVLSAKKSPKTVKSTHQKTPVSGVSSPKLLKKTSTGKLSSPKSTNSARKLRKAVNQSSPLLEVKVPTPLRKTPGSKLKSPKMTRSARKSPKSVKKALQKSPAGQESVKLTMSLNKFKTTSTPSKTVEQITNKSFYGTPQESPLRHDAVVVFSAKSVSTASQRQKKTTLTTPKVASIKKTKSTPKKMPARKTPAVKRRFVESDDDSTPIEAKSRKIEKEMQSSIKKATRKIQKPDTEPEKETQPIIKPKLSPVEMSSVLRSVHQQERQEKRKASESPSPRPSKLARLGSDGLTTTPRMMKKLKRTSPKKLAKIHERKQAYQEEWLSEGDSSMLNETVNTDSRSSRCIIL